MNGDKSQLSIKCLSAPLAGILLQGFTFLRFSTLEIPQFNIKHVA